MLFFLILGIFTHSLQFKIVTENVIVNQEGFSQRHEGRFSFSRVSKSNHEKRNFRLAWPLHLISLRYEIHAGMIGLRKQPVKKNGPVRTFTNHIIRTESYSFHPSAGPFNTGGMGRQGNRGEDGGSEGGGKRG